MIAKPGPRRRLDAEAARAVILDAAEKRLVVVGPSGIRLQEVAADAGVSHPTVLHHFGSRELLVKAVITRSLRALHATVVESIGASGGDQGQLEALMENVGAALESSGHARVILWLTLEGHPIDEADVRLSHVVDAAQALRVSQRKHKKKPSREDTARCIVLASLSLICGSVLVPNLLEGAGLAADARARSEFRRWVARLLIEHFEH
jgi:AcrR family transcriptional regulator